MVFFSCDGCAEMLKKSKVDAHAAKCRSCESVSCVDCSVSFWGDDYKKHTTCMTEAERYEKSVYKPPTKKNKMNPQEKWMCIVEKASRDSSPSSKVRSLLSRLVDLGNVPRKEKQFRNYTSNSLRLSDKSIVDEIWNHLVTIKAVEESSHKDENANYDKNKPKPTETIEQKEEAPIIISPPGPSSSSSEDENTKNEVDKNVQAVDEEVDVDKLTSKQISKAVKDILKKAPNNELKMKRLNTEVMKDLKVHKKKKKEMKTLLKKHLKANSKKLNVSGKLVALKVEVE